MEAVAEVIYSKYDTGNAIIAWPSVKGNDARALNKSA